MTLDTIASILKSALGDIPLQPDANATPQALIVERAHILAVCKTAHQHPELYFDMLSCVTGLDNGPQANTLEVIYNLYSIPFNLHLMLKVVLPRESPEVDSVASVWRTADWHEREAFDMYGIHFTNHPDLRRILMPADWEGYPLRKDYQDPQYYRDIKIEY
ncbi:NADH-quinone oxidoreductase subunit C [Dawidia soli]|uniref:NADH-quinone oxidoreductase subunit C n=1 Tax=Dawidia soli TaxID=2782352 RepID=A0AAP2D9L0_9BACT|nr:NADH-quinone oxidoreductase subunit C [Dawidia soli]MBT1687849.1 NADH-quinone oxidoreductase subunit C [Dawidia soli]